MARSDHAPVSFGSRLGGAVIIVVIVALVYGVLTALAVLPTLSSVQAIAARQSVGRGPAIVSGYFMSQPFTSLGSGLPPYVFATDTKPGSPNIHVKPTLADVRSGRLAVVVDTATGDGSRWSPYLVRTIASFSLFLALVAVVIIVVIGAALWLGGPLGARLFGNRARRTGRVPQRQT